MYYIYNRKINFVALLLLLRSTILRATAVMPMIEICTLCVCLENSEEVTIECHGREQSNEFLDLKSLVWPVAKDVRAHFRNVKLQHLPKISTRANIVELKFENTATNALTHEPFDRFKTLESLTITGNKLDAIEQDFFAFNNTLRFLDLSNNSLVAVTALERASFEQLEHVDLSHNNFKLISVHLFRALENASTVRLDHCNIYNWDSAGLPQWKVLDISWNKLTAVSVNTFSNLHKLTTFYLSHNEIQFVEPRAFVELQLLQELDLSYNFITNLAGNLFLPQSLRSINIAGNNLDLWPFAGIPQTVEILAIQDNKLTDLNLRETVNFQIMNASNNQLEEFVGYSFPALKVLDLSDNLLTELPKYLGKHLRKLFLDGNLFKRIFFEQKISLELLSMNRLSKLEELEAFSFWKLVGIEDDKERDCVEIRISHCPKLQLISETAFDDTNLCKLDLSYNQLTYLPENLTDWKHMYGEINLQGNPWDCSCSNQWMVDEILPKIYENKELQYLLDDLRCAAPQRRKGSRLVKFLNHRGAFCGGPELARLIDASQPQETYQAGFADILCSVDDEFECLHVHKGTGFIAFCVMLAITILISLALFVIIVIRRKRERRPNTFDSVWLMQNNKYYEK